MRFDYTNGNAPKYTVIAHYPMVTDHCYFSDLSSANKFIDSVCEKHGHEVRIRLYDLDKDKFIKYIANNS